MEQINKKLKESYIIDLTKKKINEFERAEIIEDYLKENKISLIKFCEIFNFKKGTVSGWLSWGKLGESAYEKLIKDGFSKSDITNMLKKTDVSREGKIILYSDKMLELLKLNDFDINQKTYQKILTLRNRINHVLFRVEKRKNG